MADEINRMKKYTTKDIEDSIDKIQSLSPMTIYCTVIAPEETDSTVIAGDGQDASSHMLIISSSETSENNGAYIVSASDSSCVVCTIRASSAAEVSTADNRITIANTSSTDTIRVSLLRIF